MDLSARTERPDGQTAETAHVVIHVCETCRNGAEAPEGPRAGAVLAARVESLAEAGISVHPVACLANCKRALSASLQRADGWSYIFGDLTADSAADLIEGARLLGASADGLMPWKGRPDALKKGMIARLPPLPSIHKPAIHKKVEGQNS